MNNTADVSRGRAGTRTPEAAWIPPVVGRESGRLCAGCGNWFTSVRKGQRHCRPSCRALAEWHEEQARAARSPLLPLQAAARPARDAQPVSRTLRRGELHAGSLATITPATLTPQPLTARQRQVLTLIAQYYTATGEACSVRYLARRLAVHPSTIYEHLVALHRKGWIPAPAAPRPHATPGA